VIAAFVLDARLTEGGLCWAWLSHGEHASVSHHFFGFQNWVRFTRLASRVAAVLRCARMHHRCMSPASILLLSGYPDSCFSLGIHCQKKVTRNYSRSFAASVHLNSTVGYRYVTFTATAAGHAHTEARGTRLQGPDRFCGAQEQRQQHIHTAEQPATRKQLQHAAVFHIQSLLLLMMRTIILAVSFLPSAIICEALCVFVLSSCGVMWRIAVRCLLGICYHKISSESCFAPTRGQAGA